MAQLPLIADHKELFKGKRVVVRLDFNVPPLRYGNFIKSDHFRVFHEP